MDIRGDTLEIGQVIDWRGHPATVLEAWQTQDDAPIKKAPVGAIIEWEENGEICRCRIVWPDLTATERRRPEEGGLSVEEVEVLLPTALDESPVATWEE